MPTPGYFLTSEYSPSYKYGSSANIPLKLEEDIKISDDFSGSEPVIPRPEAFSKCDSTCHSCKGSSSQECTSCWPGYSLNVDVLYDSSNDPYPYGYCDIHCQSGKFKQTEIIPEETEDHQRFWATGGGWICKNCYHLCMECSGPTEN